MNQQIDFNHLVWNWNRAHILKDVGIFASLYSDSVMYYGAYKDKNSCIEDKLIFFRKYPDFNQIIVNDISLENLNDNEVKCSFEKEVVIRGKKLKYPSYLIFKKAGKNWKIKVEGDLLTDKVLGKEHSNRENRIPKNAVKGDYNGDGLSEYMWIEKPQIKEEEADCLGECICYIRFSTQDLPSIPVKNCIGGTLVNEGDLNNNGSDEIGFLPEWFTSCWHSYYVWTFKNGAWVYAVEPFSTHCSQWENGVVPIEVDKQKEGNVIIRYSVFDDDELTVKTQSLAIVK